MPEPRDVAAELIQAHRRGDRKAAGRLVEFMREPLVAVGRRVLGDRASAEDAFVEVMARLLPRLDAIDPPGFWAYAHRTTRNRAVDLLRRRNERDGRRALRDTSRLGPRWSREDPVARLPSRRPGPEALVLAREQRSRLREELERLQEPRRTILVRFYDEARSYQEIADEFAISTASVKRHLAGARATLAARLLRREEPNGA